MEKSKRSVERVKGESRETKMSKDKTKWSKGQEECISRTSRLSKEGLSKKNTKTNPELKKTNTTDQWICNIPKEIENDPLYHGLLAQEDLCFILSEMGDFVIRCAKVKATKNVEIVISVKISKEPLQIKHVQIHHKSNKDGQIEWYASERFKYKSMKELLDDYIKEKRPIHPRVPHSVLILGIGLQTWEFRHSDIKIGDFIGEGQFASVHQGEIIAGPLKKRVAIKKARFEKDRKMKEIAWEIFRDLMNEARIMRVFDHPNVAKCYGIAVTKLPILVVLELVDGGTIYEYLQKNQKKIPLEEKVVNMCYATAKGLRYLHENKCIHRDIASRNILYTKDKIAKITDFGLSRMGDVYNMKKGKKIPIKWTAPETIAALVYTPKSDVFSYSIFMWEVFTDGDEPYEGLTHMEVRQRIGCGIRLDRPLKCPKWIFFLMQKCWEQVPDERYSMKEVVNFLEAYMDTRSMIKNPGGIGSKEAVVPKVDDEEIEEWKNMGQGFGLPIRTSQDAAKAIDELERKIEQLKTLSFTEASTCSSLLSANELPSRAFSVDSPQDNSSRYAMFKEQTDNYRQLPTSSSVNTRSFANQTKKLFKQENLPPRKGNTYFALRRTQGKTTKLRERLTKKKS